MTPPVPPVAAPAPESIGLAAASAAARENIAQTGRVDGAQPDPDTGTVPPAVRDRAAEIAGAPGAPVKPTPEAPTPEPVAEPTPETPEPDGEQPPEGEPPEALTVELPPRRPGEAPLVIDAGDPETAEALRRLANQAMAGEEVRAVRAAVEQEQQGLQQAREYIETDPVGFVMENLPPAMQDEIALQLLANPDVWPRVQSVLEGMLDPERRDLLVARLENRRLTMREDLRQQRESRIATQQNAQEVRAAVMDLMPDHFSPEQQGQFLRDAMTDLGRYADQMNARRIEPAHIPALLASRMAALGLDPVERAAAAANKRLRGANGTPARPGASARPASPSAPPGPKKVTATTFVEGQERRRKVAAVAPAGAGVPPATLPSPPPGATLKEATAFLRKQRTGA